MLRGGPAVPAQVRRVGGLGLAVTCWIDAGRGFRSNIPSVDRPICYIYIYSSRPYARSARRAPNRYRSRELRTRASQQLPSSGIWWRSPTTVKLVVPYCAISLQATTRKQTVTLMYNKGYSLGMSTAVSKWSASRQIPHKVFENGNCRVFCICQL